MLIHFISVGFSKDKYQLSHKSNPESGEQRMSSVLTGDEIRDLLRATLPLVEGVLDIDEQVQPNGIDLTLKEIALFSSPGSIGCADEARVLCSTSPLIFDGLGAIDLMPGCYLVTYNEIVHLPNDIMALALPRSSFLRCSVSIHTAVWDAGYSGRSQSLMVVYNSYGFRLYKNTRTIQLVFFRLSHKVDQGYQGIFQGENI